MGVRGVKRSDLRGQSAAWRPASDCGTAGAPCCGPPSSPAFGIGDTSPTPFGRGGRGDSANAFVGFVDKPLPPLAGEVSPMPTRSGGGRRWGKGPVTGSCLRGLSAASMSASDCGAAGAPCYAPPSSPAFGLGDTSPTPDGRGGRGDSANAFVGFVDKPLPPLAGEVSPMPTRSGGGRRWGKCPVTGSCLRGQSAASAPASNCGTAGAPCYAPPSSPAFGIGDTSPTPFGRGGRGD